MAACVEKGYQKVIVETNAANLVKMLREEIDAAATIEGILVDVKQLAKQLESIEFTYASQHCNRIAYLVLICSYLRIKIPYKWYAFPRMAF
ncbi:hypothetical protein D8674_016006 [Pyrus ussuriensis x Pyrus communis]|uniref:RNase H type-1 domain-containing protein n=1 Tax=Pyrus ussuriensis x Pyrus communis TaxID=2448454 RepID=A0A5N5H8L4_9ROSA|nr:hypothetical protein D8674_016006 [Pyrus ussuriensis x Pyrus communis]